jgi:mono/diheme cytochrome c family protein
MMRAWMTGVAIAAAAMIVEGSAPPRASAGAAEGKAVYAEKCKMCHSIGGEGGKMAANGGPLDGVGSKHDAAWLKAFTADPKSKKPDAKMPKVKLTDQQLDDVVAYMETLKGAAK